MRKSAREVRSLRRNRARTRSWTRKGLRSKRVAKIKVEIVSSPSKQAVTDSSLLYTHIECNDFLHRGHKQLVEDDVPVCSCKVVKGDSESACGDCCLNFLTSNECTQGFCPCGDLCTNQRFQLRKYINTKLVKTEERGWGLLADQDVKMGEFVIEYCGEVISCEEARLRSQTYELEGLQDAYIISLSGSEFIDATRKGSLGRFINHSCDPNCETRKWTVLGEVRVGIFAKKDINAGTELTYNYNFEWYGGAKVRCRCGAASCVGFLGAKSRGFQEDTYVWDDNDDRFSVENVPLYDSENDEPLSTLLKQPDASVKMRVTAVKTEVSTVLSKSAVEVEVKAETETMAVIDSTLRAEDESLDVKSRQRIIMHDETTQEGSAMPGHVDKEVAILSDLVENKPLQGDERTEDRGTKKRKQTSDVRKRLVAERLPFWHRKSRLFSNQNPNNVIASNIKAHNICPYLSSKEACAELQAAEELEAAASLELSKLHDRLRPSMEDLGKDAPDNLPIAVAEEWIALSCKNMLAVFDFNHAAIRSLSCFSPRALDSREQFQTRF